MAPLDGSIPIALRVRTVTQGSFQVGANAEIHQHALVMRLASVGYAVPCAADENARFLGVAIEGADNAGGGSGDKDCGVEQDVIVIVRSLGGNPTVANIGATVFCDTDNIADLTLTDGGNFCDVGTLINVNSSGEFVIHLQSAALR